MSKYPELVTMLVSSLQEKERQAELEEARPHPNPDQVTVTLPDAVRVTEVEDEAGQTSVVEPPATPSVTKPTPVPDTPAPAELTPLQRLAPFEGYEMPGNDYRMLDRGVLWERTDSRNQFQQDLITYRPMVVSELLNDDLGSTRYRISWLSSLNLGGTELEVRDVVVPASTFVDSRKLLPAFPEAVVTGKWTSQVVEYLNLLVATNREGLETRARTVATALGWYQDKTETFVAGPGRPIDVDDTRNTGEWLNGHTERGDLETWVEEVKSVADRPVVLLTVTATLAAPLLKLLDGAEPFIFDNSASTSTGKSSAMSLAAAAWGDPRKIMLNWRATKTAIELHLATARGVPLFLNESQHAQDEKEKVAQVIYGIAEGQSRSRARQTGGELIKGTSFETIAISNGENSLLTFTEKGGVVPRVICVEQAPFDTAERANEAKRVARRHHGHAGPAFVEHVLSLSREDLNDRYQEWVDRLRPVGKTNVAGRRAESVAVLALANELASDAGLVPDLDLETWEFLVNGGGAEEGADDKPLQALQVLLEHVVTNGREYWVSSNGVGLESANLFEPPGGWMGRFEYGDAEQFLAVSGRKLKELLTRAGFDVSVLSDWVRRGWAEKSVQTRLDGRGARLIKITHLVETLRPGGDAAGEVTEVGGRASVSWAAGVRDRVDGAPV